MMLIFALIVSISAVVSGVYMATTKNDKWHNNSHGSSLAAILDVHNVGISC